MFFQLNNSGKAAAYAVNTEELFAADRSGSGVEAESRSPGGLHWNSHWRKSLPSRLSQFSGMAR